MKKAIKGIIEIALGLFVWFAIMGGLDDLPFTPAQLIANPQLVMELFDEEDIEEEEAEELIERFVQNINSTL